MTGIAGHNAEAVGRKAYDYIIVGSGSAGGVLAARLSEDPDRSVLLIEAGSGRRSATIDIPALLFLNFDRPKFNWRFDTVPQAELGGRTVYQPRGKALGGSTAINAMVYMRGHAEDFDTWDRMGAVGWNYSACLPYFKRSENYQSGGDPAYRGYVGPMKTRRSQVWAPVQEAFMAAGVERGYPVTDDANGHQQEGFSMFDMNIGDGVRAGTAQAFLRPAIARANLTIATDTLCLGLLTGGNRTTGVRLATNGRTWSAQADAEVILCAGAAKTPQILLLSGIGPAGELAALGIRPTLDLPGVGKNLQDHTEVHLKWLCTRPVAYNRFLRPDRAAGVGLRWLATRSGVAATNGFECGAVFRSAEDVPYPDQLIHYYPVHLTGWRPAFGQHGFTLGLNFMRCRSTGSVTLRSADPAEAPLIDPRYLTELDRMVRFIDLGRDLAHARAYDAIRGQELTPAFGGKAEKQAWVREHLASAYHLAGTCRMGMDDMAVTGPDGRVHGMAGLRVVDTSLMPQVTNANLNAPTMMMAERIADMIRDRPLMPPETVPVAGPVAGAGGAF